MQKFDPYFIEKLPGFEFSIPDFEAFDAEAENCRMMLHEYAEDQVITEHVNGYEWGIVLSGIIELQIGEERKVYSRGDRYYIPGGVKHSGKIFAGYRDVTFTSDRLEDPAVLEKAVC